MLSSALVLGVSPAMASPLPNGSVSTIRGDGSEWCLGPKGSGEEAVLETQACTGRKDQNWKLVQDAARYFQIVNSSTGLCLGVAERSRVGSDIRQLKCSDANAQKWNISDQGGGVYIVISKFNKLVFQSPGKATGSPVLQWGLATKRRRQLWTFPAAASQGSVTWPAPVASAAPAPQDTPVKAPKASPVPAPKPGTGAAAPVAASAPSTASTTASGLVRNGFQVPAHAFSVTGGDNGRFVVVNDAKDLASALCNKPSNVGGCDDDEPRIVYIPTTLDLTEKSVSGPGCLVRTCADPKFKPEIMLALDQWTKDMYCAGKTIEPYDYSPAGNKPLRVGSNKTILGVGPNAGLKGRGLILQNVHNVIIRNLAITDINEGRVWGGDAITISTNVHKVWIDHNTFARVGRQFLAVGDGNAMATDQLITVSDNVFDGRSDRSHTCETNEHYWDMLFYTNGRINIVGNYIHHFGGRSPRLRGEGAGVLAHVANNYFETSHGWSLERAGANTRVLVEGNFYRDVRIVARSPEDHNALFFATQQTGPQCQRSLDRDCVTNRACKQVNGAEQCSDGSATQDLVQDAAALAPFGNAVKTVVVGDDKVDVKPYVPYGVDKVPDTVRANAGAGKVCDPIDTSVVKALARQACATR
ncbi:RICIN domain-containing protein [Roseateles sp. MS654]|uniref:RICIN domain-containing protein n=1 Tax=Roseateles sp. MS654 TaxID=3412685 RepID=UPI003C2B9EA8